MTAEREEVIDYVAPYFEQTGISIGKYYSFPVSFHQASVICKPHDLQLVAPDILQSLKF